MPNGSRFCCLTAGRCTLGELQQQVGLAKSTVHHHVTALRRAGLIRAHFTGSTSVSCYSLREKQDLPFYAEWSGFIVAMTVFTLGEILIVPAEYAQIDLITPARMRGTYYGAQSVSELGRFLGPWAGGMILSLYGGPAMFLTMGGIALFSLLLYRLGRSVHQRRLGDGALQQAG